MGTEKIFHVEDETMWELKISEKMFYRERELIVSHVSGVDHDGKSNHVGIVESRDGTTVYWN